MPHVRHAVLTLVGILFAVVPLSAQEPTGSITGRVVDSTTQQPLSGALVAVVGTLRQVQTQADGSFILSDVPAGVHRVRVSRIGYGPVQRDVTVTAGAAATVDVALQPQALMLDAVVTTGYGTQSRRDATGAVVAITEGEFNRGVISSPEQLLQGRMAGVQVTTASGEPGAGANIRIRGTSSVRAGNQPLYVIDGVPMTGGPATPGLSADFGTGSQTPRNPLDFLNPDDIENISVLKDASAAAIYGSRGSNGVVLITTKRGATGPSTTVSTSTSISGLRKKLDLLSANEYVSAGQAAGADPSVIDFGAATDWQDEIFRTAVTQDHYVSFAERTEGGAYHISLGYAEQQGIVHNASLERLTARINADRRLLDDRLTVELSLTGSRVTDRYAPVGNTAGFEGNLLGAALQANPTRPVRNPDGSYFMTADARNPVAMLAFIDDGAETSRILGSASARLDLTDWLSYKLNLGYENTGSVRRTAVDPALGPGGFRTIEERQGRAEVNNLYVNTGLIEHTLDMRRPFAGGDMEALAGFSYQRFETRGDWLRAEFFTTNQIPLVDNVDGVNNQANKAFLAASDRNVDELQSFFGRVNYDLGDRYLVTANYRIDGSTKFGRNNRYGHFPSLAVAWRLSNEDFFGGLGRTFSDLKVRAGYGITGNQEFPPGVSLALFRTNNDGSVTQVNNPNPDIKWEETAQWGLGVDFELSGGRVGGSFDYFNKTTRDLIFRTDYAQPAAVDYQWINLDGEVVNKGVEVALYALPLNTARLSWRVDYNMSFLDNVVRKLGTFRNTGAIHGQGLSGAYAQRIADGQPLYAFYMRQFTGFDANGLGTYANNEQLAFVGSPIPDMTLGLTNSFTFGRFAFSAFLDGAFGHQIYNNTANAIFLKGNLRNGRNVTRDIAASAESPNNFGEASTRFLEDGDYVRLSNVTLGYTVPVAGLLRGVRNMWIGVTGQNLFVITDYSGYDPEVNTDKSIDGVPSLGIDYTAFPRPRTFTFQVRFEL